nr:hydroxymethylglutaryl-CoA lyase [Rhizobium sp. Q54]
MSLAGHRGAAGNVCTEDFIFMCHEMGIETGVDLRQMVECARMAERIVWHSLRSKLLLAGVDGAAIEG